MTICLDKTQSGRGKRGNKMDKKYRKLRKNEIIREGDEWRSIPLNWEPCEGWVGYRVSDGVSKDFEVRRPVRKLNILHSGKIRCKIKILIIKTRLYNLNKQLLREQGMTKTEKICEQCGEVYDPKEPGSTDTDCATCAGDGMPTWGDSLAENFSNGGKNND